MQGLLYADGAPHAQPHRDAGRAGHARAQAHLHLAPEWAQEPRGEESNYYDTRY